ncbi:globin domain-containing protein [Kordiimonas marina]|uniref:globin domain-containing protein n=1 Tax=Kordiimonas marina TaxID=2872312 RepID=UPI001FF334AA|nr:globin domain-containing protein [Kordiimonas marina]MCJ9429517.1 hypothetical protein [Kordiimonas marina]
MTPTDIEKLTKSFTLVLARKEDFAASFYARLFETEPAVRPLFKSDLKAQGAKLVASLGMIVASLKSPRELTDYLSALARRHNGYGVEHAHYAVVGSVLIATFEEILGTAFTPELKSLWGAAYQAVSDAMITASAAAA